jgi:hypothetical protein
MKHQHAQPREQHRLHHQEVTGDDRVSLGGQELPPGRSEQFTASFDVVLAQYETRYNGRRPSP